MPEIRSASFRSGAAALVVPLTLAVVAWAPHGAYASVDETRNQQDTLRDAAPEGLVIGTAAAGGGHHADQDYPDPFTHDQELRAIMPVEFSSLSPENQMKWDHLRPGPDSFDFEAADAIVAFAGAANQDVRGHTLLWHSQNPDWVEQGDHSPDELREILRDHITAVVSRYAGQIDQWDVANEIFDESGALRTQENIWIRELGPGIVADAFRWAHEADPSARLFLNDYNVDGVNAKSDAYYQLAQDLLADGVPVHGFGTQAHLSLQYGFPNDLEQNLRRFADLGLSTAITELDVRMPLADGQEPTEEQLAQQAEYYQSALEACLAVSTCDSFTVWGVTDQYSWVPHTFEGEGAATIMTDDYTPKPAYYALLETLRDA
ncbi:endo-1,4-beta-xylanase [Spiractinospora alimapuensis]|uniref:endo-1,4-beta-xylanase n=1 Tax=Spiractinospora alimapuensis TaxID=2820884 RepID=UPI001F37B780|nr:endo-1,4-beta-xylanase [Spiractinospora alimapuensis]QVQ50719.1 endo-1,4-beta-xylanase [Spiractinospora alimapuensis]